MAINEQRAVAVVRCLGGVGLVLALGLSGCPKEGPDEEADDVASEEGSSTGGQGGSAAGTGGTGGAGDRTDGAGTGGSDATGGTPGQGDGGAGGGEAKDAGAAGEATKCDLECEAGQHCELVEVQCIRAPCPPVPECVKDGEGGGGKGDGVPCGKNVCTDGMVCCNASCGICAPPDGACIQIACD